MVSVRTLEVSNVRVLEPFKHDFMTFNQPIKSTIHLLSEVEANVHDFLKNNTHTHASLDWHDYGRSGEKHFLQDL